MRKSLLAAFAFLIAVPASAMTLEEAKTEANAWVASRIGDLATEFQACADVDLSKCHPLWSASVLPNTSSANSALATVTNDDPGIFRQTGCGDCWDDTVGTWEIAGVDIPRDTPIRLRANSYGNGPSAGIQLVGQFSFNGVVYEKAWTVTNGAPSYDWREVE